MMATSGETSNDDEFKIQETRGEPPPSQSIFCVMNSYAREFIFVLAVAFTAIAALQNGPLKSRKANPPVPFFPEPSLVTDFYLGELDSLTSLILEKDVSLVMYYAPWDAKSMEVRAEFEKVARFYHHEVFFAAINCWWPDGECSHKYKIHAYPLLVIFVHDVGTIRYSGPLVANYIISFLDNVLSPIVTLQHTGELLDLQARHEGVLVGYFDFKNGNQPKGYSLFYASSLHALVRDPGRKICFAVITNRKVRLKFEIKSSIQLHLWNKTEVYSDKKFSISQILEWAYKKLDQASQWVAPPGTKSRLLSDIVEKSATLILFTPQNVLMQSSYYDLFREVALDYRNCNNSAQVTSLVHRIVLQRHIMQEALTKVLEKCHLSAADNAQDVAQKGSDCDLTCCQPLKLKLRLSHSEQCFCRVCIHHTVKYVDKMKLTECENILSLILKSLEVKSFPLDDHVSCHFVEASYPIKFGSYNRLSLKCDNENRKIPVKEAFSEDISIKEYAEVKDDHVLAMVKNIGRNECSRLKFALNYSDINFPEFPEFRDLNWQVNFTGLGCRTNRTLLFIAMDTMLYHTFAENLGIDVLNEHHQTAAIIVDVKQESSYILEGSINKRSLVEFVKNYTSGTLDRFLRSAVRKLEGCPLQEGNFCVKELTTAIFLDYVLDNSTDVVLMYYAPWCAACSAVSHVFLNVANYFSNIEKVKFARISSEDHDLPWEYTVERYPTIIFFPAQRKADSVEFPSNLPITTTNLLHFVLINSQPKVRWVIAMRMCNRQCVANNLARSLTEVRRLFRDYHIILNQLHFVQNATRTRHKTKYKKFVKLEDLAIAQKKAFSYTKQLITRIRLKRAKIEQAFQLIEILRQKRDMYLKGLDSSEIKEISKQRGINKKDHMTSFSKRPIGVPEQTSSSQSLLKDEL